MEKTAQQEIQELFEVHENNFCFECGAPANQWASVNNGTFLCLSCAGIHRGFGMDISCVRSLTMDSWTPEQLEMMRKGGNDKLKEFFERYNVPMEGSMDTKYRTKAAIYYREKLKALAEGQPLPDPPASQEEALSTENTSEPVADEEEKSDENKNQSSPSALEKAKTFVEQTVDKTKEAAANITTPEFKNNVQQGFKNFGNTVASGAKTIATGVKTGANYIATGAVNTANKINEKVKESHITDELKVFGNVIAVGANHTADKVADGAKETAGIVAAKSKDIFVSAGAGVEKGAIAAKKGIIEAIGFISAKVSTKKKNASPQPDENSENNQNLANIENSDSQTEKTEIVSEVVSEIVSEVVEEQKPSVSL